MPKDIGPFVILSYYIGLESIRGFPLDLLLQEKYIMITIHLVQWLILYVSLTGLNDAQIAGKTFPCASRRVFALHKRLAFESVN